MNELRMYVEHLFEGRMLTADMIELKEEIYGNLVARYEDYVAGGMDKAEALEKTKASLTSIDDVLNESNAGTAPTTQMPEAGGAGASPIPPAASAGEAASAAKPANPANPPQAPAKPTRKKWPILVGIVAGVVVLGILATVALGVWGFGAFGRQTQTTSQTTTQNAPSSSAENGTSPENNAGDASGTDDTSSSSGAGTNAGTAQGSGFGYAYSQRHHHDHDDYDDQVEYEQTLALLGELDGVTATSLNSMANGNTTFEQMFQALPLGSYAEVVGQEQSGSSINVRYNNVPDAYDSDGIDCALVFNAVAIMAMRPDVQTVSMVIQEEYDGPNDTDTYSFQRQTLESGFAGYDCGFTTIDGAMIASEEAWGSVCSCLTNGNFCDRHCELAEIDD